MLTLLKLVFVEQVRALVVSNFQGGRHQNYAREHREKEVKQNWLLHWKTVLQTTVLYAFETICLEERNYQQLHHQDGA